MGRKVHGDPYDMEKRAEALERIIRYLLRKKTIWKKQKTHKIEHNRTEE